nr:hotdog domain-containing protein [uncultured Campylobacter sp.]
MFFGSEIKPFSKDGIFIVSEIRAKFKKPSTLGNLLGIEVKTVELKKMSATLTYQIYEGFLFFAHQQF